MHARDLRRPAEPDGSCHEALGPRLVAAAALSALDRRAVGPALALSYVFAAVKDGAPTL